MSRKVRYYEAEGTPILETDEELWRRLAATQTDDVAAQTAPTTKGDGNKGKAENDTALVASTFDSLIAAKAELQLLHGLVDQLESQSSLSIMYIPDMRSADDFHFHRNKEKLIKAEEKRQQMIEAASILTDIHKASTKRIKRDRTFYRELMGLSFFHHLCVQSTALSPFFVDLSVQHGWDVPLAQKHLVVDIQPDDEGHVSLDYDIPLPSAEEVHEAIESVERNRSKAVREIEDVHSHEATVLEEYRRQKELAERHKRAADSQSRQQLNAEQLRKRHRAVEATQTSANPSTTAANDPGQGEDDTKKEAFMSRVISLHLDPEDEEEVLACSGEGESDSVAEEFASVVDVRDKMKEEWFNREELQKLMLVHLAICNLQKANLLELFQDTVQRQASRSNMGSIDHFHFHQAMHEMTSRTTQYLCMRLEVFRYFINCIYRLPPFLESIDIRDVPTARAEKTLLLTSPPVPLEETETDEKESRVMTMMEEGEEWLTKLRPVQFFMSRLRGAAPHLKSLLPTFMQAFHHQHCLRNVVWPALNDHPRVLTHVARSPEIGMTQIDIAMPEKFMGSLAIDGAGIVVHGSFLNGAERRRLPPTRIDNSRFGHVLEQILK